MCCPKCGGSHSTLYVTIGLVRTFTNTLLVQPALPGSQHRRCWWEAMKYPCLLGLRPPIRLSPNLDNRRFIRLPVVLH